jgi:nucleotide-binding universal stress UspA family protein
MAADLITGGRPMFGSIVAGTDGSATSREAVGKAAELARLTSARLHLVTAVRPLGQAPLALSGAAPITLPAGLEEQAREEVARRLAALAQEISRTGVEVKTHCRTESPAEALIAVAEREQADLIVVGNKGMRGPRRILGSVPNSVAHAAPCAVMIVHTT